MSDQPERALKVALVAMQSGPLLQRREADGTWETLDNRPASRRGRTLLALPGDATSSSVFRVKFSPKNANLPSWTSGNIEG